MYRLSVEIDGRMVHVEEVGSIQQGGNKQWGPHEGRSFRQFEAMRDETGPRLASLVARQIHLAQHVRIKDRHKRRQMMALAFSGNLTRDPELRYGQSGTRGSRLLLPKHEAGMTTTKTTFWECKAFGEMAEHIGESFAKGQRVIVDGSAETEQWEDKETGKKRSKIMVTAVGCRAAQCDSIRW